MQLIPVRPATLMQLGPMPVQLLLEFPAMPALTALLLAAMPVRLNSMLPATLTLRALLPGQWLPVQLLPVLPAMISLDFNFSILVAARLHSATSVIVSEMVLPAMMKLLVLISHNWRGFWWRFKYSHVPKPLLNQTIANKSLLGCVLCMAVDRPLTVLQMMALATYDASKAGSAGLNLTPHRQVLIPKAKIPQIQNQLHGPPVNLMAKELLNLYPNGGRAKFPLNLYPNGGR